MQQKNKLYIFFGLIASGKSTVAKGFAERTDAAYFNSDVVRKELAGLPPTASRKDETGKGIYSSDFSRKTYDALLERAETNLKAGKSVVLDASYQSRVDRDKVYALAKHLDVRVYFILCVCPESEMRNRMERRAADPESVSDGRWEIYLKQRERFEKPEELDAANLIILDTDAPVSRLLDILENKLRA